MEALEIVSGSISILTLISLLTVFRDRIFTSGAKAKSIVDRVSSLEDSQKEVAKDIKTIKENHLAHIQTSIQDINLNLVEINTTLKFLNKEK